MDKLDAAIARLQEAARMSQQIYEKPLMITYSGGKDSDVLLHLAIKAKIPMEVVHSHTTVDMPETVYHVRDVFHQLENQGISCTVHMPTYKGKPVTMWTLIPQKRMPPMQIARYCCGILKENTGKGRFFATGVRWAESVKRKNRGMLEIMHKNKEKRLILQNDNDESRHLFETCRLKAERACNPIIDWTDTDVWDYIRDNRIKANVLYCRFNRIGCVGCPMAGRHSREKEFRLYPTYQRAYIRAFDRMLEERIRDGLRCNNWQTGEDVFHWWMEDGVLSGQMSIFEEGNT